MQRSFDAPRYWPVRLALGLARVLTRLPLRAQFWLGCRLGELAYAVMPGRRRVVKVNIDLCFPQLTAAQRHHRVRQSFRSAGMGLMETFMSWWGPSAPLRRVASVEGLEHLERARDKGRGVILLSVHFTTLDMAGRLLGLYAPVTAMYRPNANPVVERMMLKGRQNHSDDGTVIAKDDVRGMLRALRAGRVVWYAPDQGVQRKYGTIAPFFGHPAMTTTATSRLARVTGAVVLPFFAVRTPNLRGYRLVIQPPLENFPGTDEADDAARINRVLERIICQAPEQYFWLHKRFKRMPGGNPYLKRS